MGLCPEPIDPPSPMEVARTLDALEAAIAELTACVGALTMSVHAATPRDRRARPSDWDWPIIDER
jgi:hypothetical protein